MLQKILNLKPQNPEPTSLKGADEPVQASVGPSAAKAATEVEGFRS